MQDQQELLYLLVLQRARGLGVLSARRVLQAAGTPRAVFEERPADLSKRSGIPVSKLSTLNNPELFREAEAELEFILRNSYRIVSLLDPDYPSRLRHCPDSPLLLFCRGNIHFDNRKIVSIVGSRICTAQGKANCNQLVADLAPLDPLIVSGLAFGIDICAHKAALQHGLQTIACLGHGLDNLYPPSHQRYVEAICEHGGVVTEFWRDDVFDPKNFVRRNRVIAGMSEATVVVESAERGGSLVTADIAHSYDREVFAFPGRVSDPQSKGCNTLIKTERARLIGSAADLIYILGWDLDESPRVRPQLALFPDLNEDEEKVFNSLPNGQRKQLDEIAIECGMSTQQVAGLLITLELKGVVRPLPGKQFERC